MNDNLSLFFVRFHKNSLRGSEVGIVTVRKPPRMLPLLDFMDELPLRYLGTRFKIFTELLHLTFYVFETINGHVSRTVVWVFTCIKFSQTLLQLVARSFSLPD